MSNGVPDGEVSITLNGQMISGWEEVSIHAGLDMAPAVFDLAMTEKAPGSTSTIIARPGNACSVTIGGDVVIVGYVNRVARGVSASGHTIRISGRSKIQDLVDCSCLTGNGCSATGVSIGTLAKLLVQPFAGIQVQLPNGDGKGLPFSVGVTLSETPFEIIQEIAAWEGLLVHDDAKGDLVICSVGTTSMASGFAEGQNAQAWEVTEADDQIYSDYVPLINSTAQFSALGPGGNSGGNTVKDPNVTRYRPLAVISNQAINTVHYAQVRAIWEEVRRRGRGRILVCTADSWRDSAGKLWTHNMLAPVNFPSVHLQETAWIIAEWHFKRSRESGTIAEVTLMAPAAFLVEPSTLNLQLLAQNQAAQGIDPLGPADTPSTPVTAPNAGVNPAIVRSPPGSIASPL